MTRAALFEELQPPLAIVMLCLFFFSVVHKLNRDFLDAEESWAGVLYGGLSEALFLPEISLFTAVAPYLTLVVELFPVVALSVWRGRGLAILVLWVFFFVIALNGIPQFASLTYAGTLLFVHPRLLSAAVARVRTPPAERWREVHAALLVTWVVVAVTMLANLPFLLLLVLWLLASVAIVGTLLRLRSRLGVTLGRTALQSPAPYFWPILALLLLNEAGPYLGVKDWPVFRMYSNLRIDSCGSNHLFLPARSRDGGDRLVTTKETWELLGDDIAGARSRSWLLFETSREESSSWDPVSFGEAIAAAARIHGRDPEQVRLSYLSRGVTVRESLAELLDRERRHPLHRFMTLRPEQEIPCGRRVLWRPE